jgi:hypothetical protein
MNARLTTAVAAPARGPWSWLPRLRALRHGLQIPLRRLLDVAVAAALVTVVALCTLLFVVAGTARRVAEDTQLAHDRVQTYSLLIGALRSFQAASYSAAHFATPQARHELQVASAKYQELMRAALALPVRSAREEQLRGEIAARDQIVTPHLAGIAEVVARIDRIWRTEGGAAAGVEAERTAQPVRDLESLLNGEIKNGDLAIATSTQRALSINRTVVVGSVLCFMLAMASWAIIHGLLVTWLPARSWAGRTSSRSFPPPSTRWPRSWPTSRLHCGRCSWASRKPCRSAPTN